MKKIPKKNVDRRTFLSQSGAAVAATAAATTAARSAHAMQAPESQPALPTEIAKPAVHTSAQHLTLITRWADAPFGLSAQAHTLAQNINTLSDNTLHVTVAPHNDGGKTAENGIVLDTEQVHVSSHPAFAYFAGLPLRQSLDANGLEAWLTVGGGQELWDQLAGEFGDKPLLAGHLGSRPGLWTSKPVRDLTDLKTCTASVPGLGANILRAVGVSAVELSNVNPTKVLELDRMAAVEFGGAYVNHMMGIHTQAKYVATGALHVNGTTLSLRVKRALWDRLSPSRQAILTAAATQSFRTSHAENHAHAALMKTTMMRREGVKFTPFHADSRAVLGKVAEAVIAQTAGTDALARRIDTGYMGFRRAISDPIPMM